MDQGRGNEAQSWGRDFSRVTQPVRNRTQESRAPPLTAKHWITFTGYLTGRFVALNCCPVLLKLLSRAFPVSLPGWVPLCSHLDWVGCCGTGADTAIWSLLGRIMLLLSALPAGPREAEGSHCGWQWRWLRAQCSEWVNPFLRMEQFSLAPGRDEWLVCPSPSPPLVPTCPHHGCLH